VTSAVACSECGSPVYPDDRFCGTCGTPQAFAFGDPSVSKRSVDRAAKLLAELRELTAGEYEIRGEIGRGGMAVVFLAYDLRLNRKVAIKAMLPDLAFHAGMEERFKREARTAARLDHPNIVVIHSVRDAGDPLFFVMKYVDGAPLDVLIRGHAPFPIPVVQGLLLQLCGALQYAHSENVIHRDVKPANILIDKHGNVQVTDFGIAKAVDSAQLTRTGMSIGTPTYMCPEQCVGRPQSAASDQYAVGVLAYELLTGHPPFAGTPLQIQFAHVQDQPRPITLARPDCPPSLVTAIMRMLAKEPNERWPSLRDAVPLIARGLPPEAEGGRPELAELVRNAPVDRPPFMNTPPSPVPQQVNRAPSTPAPTRSVSAPHAAAIPKADVVPAGVTFLEIFPRQLDVEIGTTERLQLRARDALGRNVNAEPAWSSSDPDVASVDGSGVVTGHTAGSVTIAAMADALAAMANVQVIPASVARVDVEPNVISVRERGTFQLRVRAYSDRKKTVQHPVVTFRSADESVATIDSEGRIWGVSPGRTTAVVTVGGVSATVIVTVDAIAVPTAEMPVQRRRAPIAIGVAAAAVAAIGLTALFIATRPNDTPPVVAPAPTASAGTVAPPVAPTPSAPAPVASSAATAVPVRTPADTVVATLEVTDRSPLVVEVGETRALIARVLNKRGELLPTVPVAWESSSPAIAKVDVDGVLTALGVGRALVTARVGERTRVVAIDVGEAKLARMTVSVARDSLQVGESTTASATVLNRRGAPVEETVGWKSSNESVATVDERGTVYALGAGRTTIIASAGARSDSVAVVVTARGANAPADRTPSETDLRAVTDSVISLIEKRVVRLAQLMRADSAASTRFQSFLETNQPSAKLTGMPSVKDARASGVRVAFGIVLDWQTDTARRERTVNLEAVLDPVSGGWSIRELRFPSGFNP
jgi:eukaryotic-like serine/threonine-protein kinase